MSRSEFRWNKKRKHFAYLFKDVGEYRKNILISTDNILIDKKYGKEIIRTNIKLTKHPNPNKNNDKNNYVINHKPYVDHKDSFAEREYEKWRWNKHDKRNIKRFKKYKKNKRYFDNYKQ